MQLGGVGDIVQPAEFDKQVERRGKLARGFRECGGLEGRRLQLDANSSLHKCIITYNRDFRNRNAVLARPGCTCASKTRKRVPPARLASSPRSKDRGLPARIHS